MPAMPPTVPAEPTRDDVAAFRAYLDGVAPRRVVARYAAQHLEREESAHRILSGSVAKFEIQRELGILA